MGQLTTIIVVIIVVGALMGSSSESVKKDRFRKLVSRPKSPIDRSMMSSSLAKNYLLELIEQAQLELDQLNSVAERALPKGEQIKGKGLGPPSSSFKENSKEDEDEDCKSGTKAFFPNDRRVVSLFASMTEIILEKIDNHICPYKADRVLSALCDYSDEDGKVFYEIIFTVKQKDAVWLPQAKQSGSVTEYKPPLECTALIFKPDELRWVECTSLDTSRGKLPSPAGFIGPPPLVRTRPGQKVVQLKQLLSPADPEVKRAFGFMGNAIKEAFSLVRNGKSPDLFYVKRIISATKRNSICAVKFTVREEEPVKAKEEHKDEATHENAEPTTKKPESIWNCMGYISYYQDNSPRRMRLTRLECQVPAGTSRFTGITLGNSFKINHTLNMDQPSTQGKW